MYKRILSNRLGLPPGAAVVSASNNASGSTIRLANEPSSSRSTSADPSTSSNRLHLLPRRITCSTWGAVFDASLRTCNVAELYVQESALNTLLDLSRTTDLYLITRCDDDATEQNVLSALDRAGLFDAGLNRYKVLFCSTVMGKASIVRQLEPNMHIDEDDVVISTLKPHIKSLALVSPNPSMHPSSADDRVTIVKSLGQIFS
eukprot:CAMPEP_0184669324 /NCGR_PEP_ID=MMETSP0308-20130426/76742_1 /TAXON_ID=38269 /ORGANISM="Gloeochaete witrockiana, Strain SAG 46.84" /LENGTH=202 /DNA_ID=CAMNT_0027115529 /DNA_START=101 /DNA_END=709 /DNA_ORIENTATION=+